MIRFIRLPIPINVKKESPWNTVQEFIADAKGDPGKLSYASSVIGSHYNAAVMVMERQNGASRSGMCHSRGGGESYGAGRLL